MSDLKATINAIQTESSVEDATHKLLTDITSQIRAFHNDPIRLDDFADQLDAAVPEISEAVAWISVGGGGGEPVEE